MDLDTAKRCMYSEFHNEINEFGIHHLSTSLLKYDTTVRSTHSLFLILSPYNSRFCSTLTTRTHTCGERAHFVLRKHKNANSRNVCVHGHREDEKRAKNERNLLKIGEKRIKNILKMCQRFF